MDRLVTIKSSRYGMEIHLAPGVPFEEVQEALALKLKNSARFFEGAQMALSFSGRKLTSREEHIVLDLISKLTGIEIICIIEQDEKKDWIYRSVVEETLSNISKREGQFYRGTLRKRQVLESDSSIVILGKMCIRDRTECWEIVPTGSSFSIRTDKGDISADRVIIATGSKAAPFTGSDGSGYRLAEQLGHLSLIHIYLLPTEKLRASEDLRLFRESPMIVWEIGSDMEEAFMIVIFRPTHFWTLSGYFIPSKEWKNFRATKETYSFR